MLNTAHLFDMLIHNTIYRLSKHIWEYRRGDQKWTTKRNCMAT